MNRISAEQQLKNLFNGLAESIANATDEEILAEMTPEDHRRADELKAMLLKVVDDYKRGHSKEVVPDERT